MGSYHLVSLGSLCTCKLLYMYPVRLQSFVRKRLGSFPNCVRHILKEDRIGAPTITPQLVHILWLVGPGAMTSYMSY